jgi:hypothetical protein
MRVNRTSVLVAICQLLGEMDFSICAVKLDFECVEKTDLSNNTAKALWRKIKRIDRKNGKERTIHLYLNQCGGTQDYPLLYTSLETMNGYVCLQELCSTFSGAIRIGTTILQSIRGYYTVSCHRFSSNSLTPTAIIF